MNVFEGRGSLESLVREATSEAAHGFDTPVLMAILSQPQVAKAAVRAAVQTALWVTYTSSRRSVESESQSESEVMTLTAPESGAVATERAEAILGNHAKSETDSTAAVEGELLSTDQFAERVGIKRPTVHSWLKQGKILGWSRAKRGVVLPSGQLDDQGRPIAGLAEISAIWQGEPRVTWSWLTRPSAALGGQKPLDRLKNAGQLEPVLEAARGQAQGDFA